MPPIKVGVFDSGVGGLSVVGAIKRQMPELEVVFKNDAEHVPYGTRPIEEIYQFTKPILQQMIDDGCQAIVIACNTVTTNLISRLRPELSVPLVGMEPAVKPAAEKTTSKIIAVCATPRTLASDRYHWLKQTYANNIRVLEPDCSDWAQMIEDYKLDRQKIADTVEDVCRQGADVIVLGCTHYHWIEDLIRSTAVGRAQVIQPEEPVIKQLRSVLAQLA